MPRKAIDVLQTREAQIPAFSSRVVCDVLGIEIWRLHNYLACRKYKLRPVRRGTGKGSRQWFYIEDIYRLGIRHHLTKDGFSPGLISRVLERIEDKDFFEFDERGHVPHPVIVFNRGQGEPEFELRHSRRLPAITLESKAYYFLDVAGVVDRIDARVKALRLEQTDAS